MRPRPALALVVAAAVAFSGCFGSPPNKPPAVTAHASVDYIAAGDEVILTGQAFDDDGSVVSFKWEVSQSTVVAPFTIGTKLTVPFRFALPGNYTVTFTATDDQGASASASLPITVVARFAFTSDWGDQAGFVIRSPVPLDPNLIVVNATPSGSPPFSFRVNEGLTVLNNTTVRVSLAGSELKRYSEVRVEAAYNGTASGARTFRVLPFFGSENESQVRYDVATTDTRFLPEGNSTLSATGRISAQEAGGTAVLSFAGTGTTAEASDRGGDFANGSYAFSSLAWNQSTSLVTGVLNTVDYAWSGTGVLTTDASGSVPTNISLTDFHGARYQGNLLDYHAVGNGTFGVPGTSNGGTIAYTLHGSTTTQAIDGQGVTRAALQVTEHHHYNGSLGGASYDETNDSESLIAVSDTLVNTELYVSWNTTGFLGATNVGTSGSRFLDADNNGVFNPDPRPALPFDGQYFVGMAPAELQEGDRFVLTDGLGAKVNMTAHEVGQAVLTAAAFPEVPVPVVTVDGAVTGPVLGTYSARVVASGPYNGLRLESHLSITSATGAYSADWTLAAKGL